MLGTLVWDQIHLLPPAAPAEGWGGIAYSLEALSAGTEEGAGWEIRPLIKLGGDLERSGRRYLAGLAGIAGLGGVRTVPEPNNRVTLHYRDAARRGEQMSGGVPPWTMGELRPLVAELDALFINFISGYELDLATLQALRAEFGGPMYADLHSLLLGPPHEGQRQPARLSDAEEWLRCCDFLQVNEDEVALLAGPGADPQDFVERAVRGGVSAFAVTQGERGARCCVLGGGDGGGDWWRVPESQTHPSAAGTREVQWLDAPVPAGALAGDPTGCGDVWGATFFRRLLAGDSVQTALKAATRAAAANVGFSGAEGLRYHLQGRDLHGR